MTSILELEPILAPQKPAVIRFFGRLVSHRSGFAGFIIILIIVFTAIFADQLAPKPYNLITPRDRLKPMWFMEGGSLEYPLGTDALGRDIASRIIHGSRISLMVGLASVLLGAGIGVSLGLLAGFFGGRPDSIISWLMNVQLSFPYILLALFLMAAFKGGLTTLILVLAIGGWVRYARIIRGQVLSVKEEVYVTAAQASGISLKRILTRHILPNSFAPIIVVASFTMADTILSEASLSFLGLGIDPSIPSWGQMLSDGRNYLNTQWWIAFLPGLAISITVLGINLFGDWLRDYLDPRLRL
jgi:peptide/nickel transport system permease protein